MESAQSVNGIPADEKPKLRQEVVQLDVENQAKPMNFIMTDKSIYLQSETSSGKSKKIADLKYIVYSDQAEDESHEYMLTFNNNSCLRLRIDDEEEFMLFNINLVNLFAGLHPDKRLKIFKVPGKSLWQWMTKSDQQGKRNVCKEPPEEYRQTKQEVREENEAEKQKRLQEEQVQLEETFNQPAHDHVSVEDNLEGHIKEAKEAQAHGRPGKRVITDQEKNEWAEASVVGSRMNSVALTWSDFQLEMVIGRGAFGKVYLARLKAEGKDAKLYAIKCIRKDILLDKDQIDGVGLEKDIMLECEHPFINGMDYVFQDKLRVYFVMPFVRGAEMYKGVFLKKKRFPEDLVKFYAVQLILAIGYLHSKNYAHRDLKLENILLDQNGFIKVIDFGLSKFIKDDSLTYTCAGTPMYIAPEQISSQGHNLMVDWWALGILMFEMMFGEVPFWSKNQFDMQKKIIKNALKFPSNTPAKYSQGFEDVIVALLQKDPKQRLGASKDFEEILAHPYFADVDREAYLNQTVKPPFVPDFANKDLSEFFTVSKNLNLTKIPTFDENRVAKQQGKFAKVFK